MHNMNCINTCLQPVARYIFVHTTKLFEEKSVSNKLTNYIKNLFLLNIFLRTIYLYFLPARIKGSRSHSVYILNLVDCRNAHTSSCFLACIAGSQALIGQEKDPLNFTIYLEIVLSIKSTNQKHGRFDLTVSLFSWGHPLTTAHA